MLKEFIYTCKPDDEIKGAEEKFAESLQHAQVGMYNLLENDVRTQICIGLQLLSFGFAFLGRANITNGIFR